MRLVPTLILMLFAASALAQSPARPRPPGTSPLVEPPPPPPIVETDPALEPQITVRNEDGQTVQEYRVRGKLYMVRVTPKHGRPYVMIDHKGDGQFVRGMDNLDTGVRVPQWVIAEF
jgi:hypothetical protein